MSSPVNNGSPLAVTNGGNKTTVLDPSKPTLSVCVLSAYDLPVRDPPLHVSITVGDNNNTVKIGPPSQRHKDRNSFKFPRDAVQLHADSLPELYQTKAIVKVVYPNPSQNMTAEYSLNQLKLHETVWIILQLDNPNDDPDGIPPTLRLQWTLHGPYRPEIGFLVHLVQNWFQTVDRMEATAGKVLAKLPDAKFLWIPAAPILATAVVTAPILAGVAVVTLPVAVPIIVILLGILGGLVAAGCLVYASTKQGRTAMGSILGPAVQTVVATKAGQTALYQTGPRPTPVSMCRVVLPDGFLAKLFVSLAIDAIGSSSYLIPVVGEITDLGWAPIQTMLLMAMYEGQQQKDLEWLKYVSFMEEILPFTDIMPTATLGWFIQCGIPHWFGKDVAATVESVLATAVPKSQPKRSAPVVTPSPVTVFKDEVTV